MGVKERREREKQELRQRIVDTARDLFARDGYEAVSMRRIADAIEYSPTAIYLYFPDKSALFREICKQDFHSLAATFQRIGRIEDPVERIRQIGLAYVRFGVKNPNHYRLMFMTKIDIQPAPEDLAHKGDPTRDGYSFLKQAVQEAIDGGAFRDGLDDAELVTQTLWAAVHGVTSLEVTMGDDDWVDWRSVDKRSQLINESVLRGLCKPGKFKGGAS
jgi:AcrR family transcriptional regulator